MEIFTVVVENQPVSAIQDLIAAYAGSGKKLEMLQLEVTANGQTTVGNYPMRVRYLPATVTHGTGGSAVTPVNDNPNGAAASFTARRNDVTQAVSSGSAVTYIATQFNPITGYFWQTPTQVGDEPKADLSGALVVSLDGIAGTLGISATVWLREV